MDSDGGLPGRNNASRAIATVVPLLAFLSQGHSHGRRIPFTRGTADFSDFFCPENRAKSSRCSRVLKRG
jgi:hypothetical protein